jgi:hypothetical protein
MKTRNRTLSPKAELMVKYLAGRLPTVATMPEFVELLGWRAFLIVEENSGQRGFCIWRGGTVAVDVSTLRHRNANSVYTKVYGKSDISPVGVLCHELGHLFSYQLQRRERKFRQEWDKIHASRRRTGITSYARDAGPEEDLAESHRLFLLNHSLLRDLSPDRHAYLVEGYSRLMGGKVWRPEEHGTPVQAARAERMLMSKVQDCTH